MMSYPWFRHGTFAVVDGLCYPVSYSVGDPWVRLPDRPGPVPVEACEQVVSVQVYATYRGHSVLVDDVDKDGNALVMEAEWDELWATVNGFVHQNGFEYFKTVDLRDLRDYHEKQTDLLFLRWREQPGEGDRPRSGTVQLEDGRRTEVTTRAEYHGQLCEVANIEPDGAVTLYYLGADEARAEAEGFKPTADDRWRRTVDIHDLARYQEHHRDLDFEVWRTVACATKGT